MDAVFAERYAAMSSRDTRFDGQFITGVHSTGIYCRPSCPAMTPHAKNITFYRTAAAAHEAGLRACKRCQPDAVPGSPDWNLHDDLASRAMRLIGDGVVEREGVPGLASRLGYTARHLTRVLTTELGAGPLALARANRAQTARTLLVSTDLSIADVAFAAGFSSIRQFNDTILAVYETTPSALRLKKRITDATPPGTMTLRLPARPPFDGPGLMRYLSSHAVRGVESGDDATYTRALQLPAGVAEFTVTLDGPAAVTVTARLASVTDLSTLVSRVRRLFDLDADSVSIDSALSRNGVLAPLVARTPGIRLPGSVDAYETLFRTMIGQQISVAAARTVLGRLSDELSPGMFPTPQLLAEHGREVLRGPATRVASIVRVAEEIVNNGLTLDVGLTVSELRERLVALPGIGEWTATYVAMRVLSAPDLLLSSDLVMLSNARKLGIATTSRELSAIAESWAPWRSYAGMHLWRGPTIAP